MVGLLWTRTIAPDGTEEFHYQCNCDEAKNSKVDTFFFWTSLYAGMIAWGVLVIIACFSFSSNVFTLAMQFVLCGWNWYAYYNCSKCMFNFVIKKNSSTGKLGGIY